MDVLGSGMITDMKVESYALRCRCSETVRQRPRLRSRREGEPSFTERMKPLSRIWRCKPKGSNERDAETTAQCVQTLTHLAQAFFDRLSNIQTLHILSLLDVNGSGRCLRGQKDIDAVV